MKFFRELLLVLLLLTLAINGCIIVKMKPDVAENPVVTLSPKPEIPMSDILVRSSKGDMIAYLPEGWDFIDVQDKASADIFAVAVNQDYTLTAVFSSIRKNDKSDTAYSKDGLLGIARISLANHQTKSGDAVKQVGNYSNLSMGAMNFAKYESTTTAGLLTAQTAVYVSSLNQYYEFSIVPMNITGKPQATQKEALSVFNSILATIQY
jgi:hypothetical protein